MFEFNNDIYINNKCYIIKKCINVFINIDPSLSKKKLYNLFDTVLKNYNYTEFHNFTHAYEVFKMTEFLMQFIKNLTLDNKKILLYVALCHDINHLGINNNSVDDIPYDIYLKSGSKESLDKYFSIITQRPSSYDNLNDIMSESSYNETVHIEMCISILKDFNYCIFDNVNNSKILRINDIINTLILSTDITFHDRYLEIIDDDLFDITIMIHILKLADISHPLRPFNIHLYWVFNLLNEGKSNLLDSDIPMIANDTLFFINKFVKPLVDRFVKLYPKSICIHNQLENNIKIWNQYIKS